ncbi:BUD22 family protein [Candida albicans]|uniref:BUD22 family protein n=1 Tax=Candida albicans TaxID=5476 RepID=A0A8H6F625_CANAX|nr:BUD22 family protein [Candida albicans]
MWKLDLLESKFNKSTPRFPHTKKLLIASNHNHKLLKKIPKSPEDAQVEIEKIKSDIFQKKYHSAYSKLAKEVEKKTIPVDDKEFVSKLITSKLIKIIQSACLNPKELKTNPPTYIGQHLREIVIDKSNECNPSSFYITFCQNDKAVNNFVANLWNNKNVKKILDEIEWSFRVVRGNLTRQEKDSRIKASVGEEDDSEDEHKSLDLEDAYDKFAIYDKVDNGSGGEEQQPELDPNVNYNEVTDEEPSEEESSEDSSDDFFEDEPPKKKQKQSQDSGKSFNLPQLASGYFSGVKEITTQRKNRRGQRARQKIWAKKYGKEAKHVKKNQEILASERERRQMEFEERQRKRELKAKLLAEKQQTGANSLPLGERKPTTSNTARKIIHPSWEAKRLEKEKLKNVKFQGKKVVFD